MHIYIYSLVFIFIYLCLPFVALVFSCMSISVHLPKIVLGIVCKPTLKCNEKVHSWPIKLTGILMYCISVPLAKMFSLGSVRFVYLSPPLPLLQMRDLSGSAN